MDRRRWSYVTALFTLLSGAAHAASGPVWISSSPSGVWLERPLSQAPGAQPPSLRLTGATEQTMRGFGGALSEIGWSLLAQLPAAARDRVLRDLFDPQTGSGFSIARIPIGASDFALGWYSADETDGDWTLQRFSLDRDRKYLMPFAHAAKQINPRLELFASPWSPPTWMKTPAVYNYGTLRKDRRTRETYARYLLKFVDGYRAAGLPIAQLHVQNEPVADQKFPSCVWKGADLRDFIRDQLGPLFRAQRSPTEIWLGTINSDDFDGWAATVLTDEAARSFVKGVGYQYGGKMAIGRTHASWPELPLMQTESECGDGKNTWEYAHFIFGLVHHYLSNGAVAYVTWNLALPPDGKSSWGWRQNSLVTIDPETKRVSYNPEFQLMRHFSAFVPPGSRRLATSGVASGFALAFETPTGGRVVVLANPLPTARPVTIEAGEGAHASVTVDPQSFNTFVWPR
jgi:glucosylceramidase